MKILVTGARGFIGSTLVQQLLSKGDSVICTTSKPIERYKTSSVGRDVSWLQFADSRLTGDVIDRLGELDSVVYSAANASIHSGSRRSGQPDLFATDADDILRFATQCAASGVPQLIFLSTIGVNGDCTNVAPFTESSPASPHDAYSRSKLCAELALQRLSQDTGMQVTCLRAPLVYGPSARGTFAKLVAVIKKGIPLPLDHITNQRSLLAVDNLCDFIVSLTRRKALLKNHELFLLSDGEDVSTTTLIQRVARAVNAKERLFRIHPAVLKWMARLPAARNLLTILTASLVIDSTKSRSLLRWSPPTTMEQQLSRLIQC